MANTNRPSGLSPHSYLNGTRWNGQGTTYFIPSTDGNAYAIGDPVVLAGSGDTAGVASVTLATAGSTNLVLGPIVSMGGTVYSGMHADPSGLDTTIIPATKTKGYYVLVADDPWILFEVQEDNGQTALAVTDIGLNISLKSGTNNGYVSAWILDNATKATTAALQMKLVRLVQRADNAIGSAGKWLCLINQHQFKGTVVGV